MNDAALVQLDTARHALAECRTVMEAKQIADAAEAARVYLQRTNASVETVNQAAEIRTLAERQMGEFLKTMPDSPRGVKKQLGSDVEPNSVPTLAEIGITKKQSATAQKLADIPKEEFTERVAVLKSEGEIVSASKVLAPDTRHAPNRFNLPTWKRQARSVMTTWLNSVPQKEREAAAAYLRALPDQILLEHL